MLEFFDVEIFAAVVLGIISIFLLVASQSSKKKRGDKLRVNWFFKTLIAFMLMIPFITMFISQSDALRNIEYFNTGATLKCEGGDKNSYLVSQEHGWSVANEYYFLKKSLLVRADKCQKEEL